VMNLALHYVAVLSIVMRPFLPFTSDKLQGILNLDAIKEEDEMVSMLDILAAGEPLLNAGHKIGQPVHLFSRIDDAVIEAQKAKLVKTVEEALVTARAVTIETTPIKEEIAFDDFMKLDIRTATILTAEKVKKADKLLKLEVDMGSEQRTVVSGIAEHYTPEEVIGKRVSILANLASRKIRGVESKGMILMAEDADGKLSFVSPEDGWQNGATVC
ncbi:MAG TPA: methionine--tRNA ligase subunit beta, partial [Saprospirales bacterium]|nr:methionine--tRNA ligase subunit beta [Saprospirales bacterium]